MAESPNDLSRRRVLIWGSLLLLLVLAIVLLAMAMSGRDKPAAEPAPEPTEVRRPIRIQVVDTEGKAIPYARVFVSKDVEAPDAEAGTWDAEAATLELPFTGEGRTLMVQARGFKTQRVSDVIGDRQVTLEPGYLARFVIVGDASLPAPPIALYVRLNPLPADGVDVTTEQANTILDLMEAVEEVPGSVPEPPRAGFGLLLSAERAAAGVRLPIPGRYVAKWGLMDEKVGTWYGLYEHPVVVDDRAGVARLEIPITDEGISRTLEHLREQIQRMRSAAPTDGPGGGD